MMLVRNILFWLFLFIHLIEATQEEEQQQHTTNPQSSSGQHQSTAGSSSSHPDTSNPAPLERVHLASQARFIPTSTIQGGVSRYFGMNEAEQYRNSLSRINSISRQRKGWKSDRESLSKRYKYLENKQSERKAKEAVISPSKESKQYKTYFTAEEHILQSKSYLSKPIKRPVPRKVRETAVLIDHPEAVRQHKIIQSKTSAFHKVQPTSRTNQNTANVITNPPPASPTHSTSSSSSANSQDKQMSKIFGGWKTPSRKRKRE